LRIRAVYQNHIAYQNAHPGQDARFVLSRNFALQSIWVLATMIHGGRTANQVP
jgi:hypothetical protein